MHPISPDALHTNLNRLNRHRLRPALESELSVEEELPLRLLEREFVERERAKIRARALTAPDDADRFVAWFEALEENGPGQHDLLFPWLAERATLEDFRWFLSQEVAGEAGFEDLLALTQMRMPVRAKLEMARNYWDELGRGRAGGMHGPLLQRLATALDITAPIGGPVWESLALANMMCALAANRGLAYQSVGALGVIELTAPGRARYVDLGLRRLGVPAHARRYFSLHATLDVKHSAAWDREVLHALVAEDPNVATALAEGALLRLAAGARCFDRYRERFGIQPQPSSRSSSAGERDAMSFR